MSQIASFQTSRETSMSRLERRLRGRCWGRESTAKRCQTRSSVGVQHSAPTVTRRMREAVDELRLAHPDTEARGLSTASTKTSTRVARALVVNQLRDYRHSGVQSRETVSFTLSRASPALSPTSLLTSLRLPFARSALPSASRRLLSVSEPVASLMRPLASSVLPPMLAPFLRNGVTLEATPAAEPVNPGLHDWRLRLRTSARTEIWFAGREGWWVHEPGKRGEPHPKETRWSSARAETVTAPKAPSIGSPARSSRRSPPSPGTA